MALVNNKKKSTLTCKLIRGRGEMVDAADLKSADLINREGSIPSALS
jgi:hypothetical protein